MLAVIIEIFVVKPNLDSFAKTNLKIWYYLHKQMVFL